MAKEIGSSAGPFSSFFEYRGRLRRVFVVLFHNVSSATDVNKVLLTQPRACIIEERVVQ